MTELKSPGWRKPAPTEDPSPGNATSGEGISLAEAAELEGVPTVQALRQRIKRGTLRSVRVMRGGAIVAGVELEELERVFGATAAPLEGEQGGGKAEQGDKQGEQAPTGAGGPAEDKAEARPEQGGGKPEPEATSSRGSSNALQTVEMAVQGWREAKDALELARTDHREELARIAGAHERELRAATGGGRLARLASALLATLLAVGVGVAFNLQADAARVLADERGRAGKLEGQLEAVGEQNAKAALALEVELERGRTLSAERERIAGELEELQAERQAAQEAAKAALSRIGWR